MMVMVMPKTTRAFNKAEGRKLRFWNEGEEDLEEVIMSSMISNVLRLNTYVMKKPRTPKAPERRD